MFDGRCSAQLLLLVIGSCFMQSCTTVTTPGYSTNTKWRFGITRIKEEKFSNRLLKNDVGTFGVWRDTDSYGAGFVKKSELSVPLDCGLVILVRNEEQLEKVIQLLEAEKETNGELICAAID